jgi:hypothetical protein
MNNEPRQFWIRLHKDGTLSGYIYTEKPVLGLSSRFEHLIEKSAYDSLLAENAKLAAELVKANKLTKHFKEYATRLIYSLELRDNEKAEHRKFQKALKLISDQFGFECDAVATAVEIARDALGTGDAK